MTYFISIEELKNSAFNANLDDEYLQPAIEEAQSVYLREILGDRLYNTLTNKIDNNTLSGIYKTLVDNYIKPFLRYEVQSVVCIPLNYKQRNAGIINQYDQGFSTTTVKDTMYIAEHYQAKAEFYSNRLTTFLQQNASSIPEYAYSCDNVTNPSTSQNVTTIYLGGRRNSRCTVPTGSGGGGKTDSVEWENILNKPDFATVATSGSYNDLSDKPVIPTVPTNVSAFTNDAGYLTQHQSLQGYATENWVENKGYSTFSGSYNDLADKPTIPTVNNAVLTVKQGGVTKGTFSANANENVEINLEAGGSGSTDWNDIANKPDFATVATSGSYNDLSDKPVIPTVPTNVSSFTNDAGYLTQHQSLAGYATENWVQQQGYSTFSGSYNDLADKPTIPAAQVNSDWNATSGMGQILNKPTLATVATSGNYNDLSNKPSMTAETWTFTVDNGQGGTTTVTKTIWVQ